MNGGRNGQIDWQIVWLELAERDSQARRWRDWPQAFRRCESPTGQLAITIRGIIKIKVDNGAARA